MILSTFLAGVLRSTASAIPNIRVAMDVMGNQDSEIYLEPHFISFLVSLSLEILDTFVNLFHV